MPEKPDCRECGHNREVVKFQDIWLCRVHLKIRNTRQSQIVLPAGVDPPYETKFTDIYPNRAARRAAKRVRS